MVDHPDDPRNRAARISAAYDKAVQGKPQQTQPQSPAKQGSEQVRNSAPGMHLRPSGPMRQPVDDQAHRQAMAKDDAKAKDMSDAIKSRQPTPDPNKDRTR